MLISIALAVLHIWLLIKMNFKLNNNISEFGWKKRVHNITQVLLVLTLATNDAAKDANKLLILCSKNAT